MTRPTPLEKKRALGNPGHRPLPKPSSVHPVAPLTQRPPRGLGAAGRALWRHVGTLPWVADSDAVALHGLCQLADLAALLRADIAARGVSYEARGRRYSNPAVPALAEAEKRLFAGMATFGLTPTDRARMGIAEVKPTSKLELLESRREARRVQSPSTPAS